MTTNLNSASFETLRIVEEGHVLTVVLNRPQARNAMSLGMCHDIISFFNAIRFETSVRLVVIRGEDPVFCSGIDLKEFKDQTSAWVLVRRNLGLDAFLAIENCPVPVVAVVQGSVVGAGAEIMAASDFAIARRGTVFRWPEVVWGAVGATQRLPRIVGMAMAKDLLLTGRSIDADEALRLRLVTRVIEANDLENEVSEVKRQLADGFPLAARLVKKTMMLGRDAPIQIGIDIERQALERSMADKEWLRGIEAFEKRKSG